MNVEVNGTLYDVVITEDKLIINNREIQIGIKENEIIFKDKKFHLDFYEEGEESLLIINGMIYLVSKKSSIINTIKEIKAPISGKVIKILVQTESTVEKGESLVILEAMKMFNEIKSPRNGKIKNIFVHMNQLVKVGEVIIDFK